jgi:hypothetical protein
MNTHHQLKQMATGMVMPTTFTACERVIENAADKSNEGRHALKTLPDSWRKAGPTPNGTANFVAAGPGVGGGNDKENRMQISLKRGPCSSVAMRRYRAHPASLLIQLHPLL